VVLGGAIVLLRWRKLRRDEIRILEKHSKNFLPPPSPYQPSKGFRLLDGSTTMPAHRDVQRPRLDPEAHYIFGETTTSFADDVGSSPHRHDQRWALDRASRRRGLSQSSLRVVMVAAAVVLILLVVGFFLERHTTKLHRKTSPTSTTSTNAGSQWPNQLVATTSSSSTAAYDIPTGNFTLVATAHGGTLQLTVRNGTPSAVVFQGAVASGASETLSLSGNTTVAIDPSADASLSLHQSSVVLPSSAGTSMTLSFSTPAG
jgi:hypothetical protein